MTRFLVLAALAFALAGSTALAQSTPTMRPGDNGMDTSFGRIQMPPRPDYAGPATPVEAKIVIKNGSGAEDAHILMFGFNGLSDNVDVRLQDLTSHGASVPIEKDDRPAGGRQPKVWISPRNLSLDQELVLRGTVTARANGQFHVGAIVIAFGQDFEKFVTPQGEIAELYAFGLLSATGVPAPPGRPPFEGQGNVASAGVLAVLAAVGAALVLRRAR